MRYMHFISLTAFPFHQKRGCFYFKLENFAYILVSNQTANSYWYYMFSHSINILGHNSKHAWVKLNVQQIT